MKVEVTFPTDERIIQLSFDEPLPRFVEFQLRLMDFKSRRNNLRSWHATKSDARMEFALKIRETLAAGTFNQEFPPALSTEPSNENIDLKKSRIVSIVYEGKDGSSKSVKTVIFEPTKKAAQILANYSGGDLHGADFIEAKVGSIGLQIKKAKELRASGHVIKAEDIFRTKGEKVAQQEVKSISDNGVLTKESTGDNFEEIEIPIPETAKFTATIKLAKNEKGKFQYANTYHKKFGDFTGSASPISKTDEQFAERSEALASATQEIKSEIKKLIETGDSILNNEDRKVDFLSKALKAVQEFEEKNGLNETEEVETKEEENAEASAGIEHPEKVLEQAEQAREEKKYSQTAEFLDTLFKDIQQGFHYQQLPHALLAANKPNIKSEMAKLGWSTYEPLINHKNFRENLETNLWNLIPEEFKKVPTIKPIDWKPKPTDDGLKKIIAKFASLDDLREGMLGVFFDKEGIVATDAHKLLFLHQPKKEDGGLFCMSKKCWENINVKNEPGELDQWENDRVEEYRSSTKFPNYKQVVPQDVNQAITIDPTELLQFLAAIKKSKFWDQHTKGASLKLGELHVGVNVEFLTETLTSFQRLGYAKIDIGLNKADTPILITPEGEMKNAHSLKTDFAIVMPVLIEPKTGQEYPDKGDLYFDLDKNQPITHGIAEIECACEIEKEKHFTTGLRSKLSEEEFIQYGSIGFDKLSSYKPSVVVTAKKVMEEAIKLGYAIPYDYGRGKGKFTSTKKADGLSFEEIFKNVYRGTSIDDLADEKTT